MKNVIIKGDFPEGSNIDFTNYFRKEEGLTPLDYCK